MLLPDRKLFLTAFASCAYAVCRICLLPAAHYAELSSSPEIIAVTTERGA